MLASSGTSGKHWIGVIYAEAALLQNLSGQDCTLFEMQIRDTVTTNAPQHAAFS